MKKNVQGVHALFLKAASGDLISKKLSNRVVGHKTVSGKFTIQRYWAIGHWENVCMYCAYIQESDNEPGASDRLWDATMDLERVFPFKRASVDMTRDLITIAAKQGLNVTAAIVLGKDSDGKEIRVVYFAPGIEIEDAISLILTYMRQYHGTSVN